MTLGNRTPPGISVFLRVRNNLRFLRIFLPLTMLFVLFSMSYSAATAQGVHTCDIWVPEHTEERTREVVDPECESNCPFILETYTVVIPDGYHCREVPEYFLDNTIAVQRTIEEISRRRAVERAGGAQYKRPDLADFGYRCPDAQGNCPTQWIPSPQETSGLSSPNKFAGSFGSQKANAHVQRINGAGIGDPSILNQNPIDAVDIWGEGAAGGGEVCFDGDGRILFVDTAAMPRSKSYLSTYRKGKQTCARISGPGQVIFLPPE